MRVGELLKSGAAALVGAGVERSPIEARLLLGKILNKTSEQMILSEDDDVNSSDEEAWHKILQRRLNREPFAYLEGRKEFYGLDFLVTPDVLIPRPETESLVEGVLDWIKRNAISKGRILDLGTGSGCIALSLARNLPQSFDFVAVDISEAALKVAKENTRRLRVENISFVQANLADATHADWADATIWVSNPPYIPSRLCEGLAPEISRYEPRLALDGGSDGLDFYRLILGALEARVQKPRLLAFETMGPEQSEEIRGLQKSTQSIVDLWMP